MGCGCKNKGKGVAATPAVQVAPRTHSSVQEAEPEKKIGNRIIKREIR
jgi:hypothetical protein